MKKILAFLSAAVFLGSSTLAVSACGPTQGAKIEIKLDNPPEEAKDGADPLVQYVYNNQYIYSKDNASYLLTVAAQLVSDKLYNEPDKFPEPIWKEFYQSEAWQRGSFSSFGYTLNKGTAEAPEKPDAPTFSFRAKDNKQFIVQVKDNDLNIDKNIIRSYWFITNPTSWSKDNANFDPKQDTIVIPDVSAFDGKEKDALITQSAFIHLYLTIANYRIDFSAEINFNFRKIVDKNNKSEVILDARSTFAEPFGKIDFNNTKKTYDKVISNIVIDHWTPAPNPTPEP